jgi:hypothetical protein
VNSVVVLDEPQLEFASGGKLEHPCDGLTLFGPTDSQGIERPPELSYGVIGTQSGVTAFREFAEAVARPILTDNYLDDILWPHFPGFEEAFHALLPAEPDWVGELDTLDLKKAATERDEHKRVFEVSSLFLNRLRTVKKSHKPLHFFVVVIPDFVFANCRPVSRFQGGHGHRVSKREQRLRAQMLDFFEAYEPERYSWTPDFRFQIKLRAMELGVPIQIIRESTLHLAKAERRFGGRQLTPLSSRAWNLSTALYFKSGGTPWKLSDARKGVCHVGVSFKDMDAAGAACSTAQMFLDDGDGIVARGDEGGWASGRRNEHHLNKDSACRLLSGILDTYQSFHNKKIERVFLHSRSTIDEKEFEGYQAACPKGVKLVAVRVATERLGLRLYRGGTSPVLRGTFWQVSPKRGFLWTSGFKPRLRVYDGSEIPRPLCIDIQHGDSDVASVAKDILGLTKLNYNSCNLGEKQPVTMHFSNTVGEILSSNRTVEGYKPNFRYYI